MGKAEEIDIEEEEMEEKEQERITTEEFKVKGEELVESIKKLIQEAGVRRIVVQQKDGRVLVEIPMVIGLAGILLLPTYSALALIAALVTECSILVDRAVEKSEEEVEESPEVA
jgi:hypothetical protein